MVKLIASSLAALSLVAGAVSARADTTTITLSVVADGDLAWCSAGDKLPDTDGCATSEAEYATGRWARRHTHAGIPYVQEIPPVHGWGVPASVFPIAVPADALGATLHAEVAFGWDESVPGGGGNDVELHLWADEARTDLVATTLGTGDNMLLGSPHTLSVELTPGETYYLQEDVFAGEHNWWLSNAHVELVVEGDGDGG